MATAQRLGVAPAARSELNRSTADGACPDVFEVDAAGLDLEGAEGMRTGTVYGVIGTLATKEQIEQIELPEGASVAGYEGLVFVPEEVLRDATLAYLARQANAVAA